MPDPPAWITWLRKETEAWVKDGLIDESQREKIVERYPIPEGPPPLPKKEAKNRLPAVLIGLAVLLIGVGLLLFYAANWKRMTPSVKLIQVFSLLVVTNGAAFFFLFRKSAWTTAGRGLLLLALLIFGAAIGLVAQTYHISAHPTGGILIWSLAAFAMAGVTRERWAFYLGFLLLFIWDTWERTVFDNPNYAMLPALAVIYALSVWIRSEVGRFAAVILGILWFYEVNFHHLVNNDYSDAWPIFILTQIPFGALLIGLALTLQKSVGVGMATMLRILGWITIYSPLLILAWPIDFDVAFTWQLEGATPFLIQFGVVTILAGVATALLKFQGNSTWSVLVIAVAAGIALTCTYLESETAYMTIMLMALILFHGVTLYAGAKIGLPGSSVMALILAIVSIAVRCIGHLFLADGSSVDLIPAALSGVFFVAIIYLINELVRVRNPGESDIIHQILSAICIVVIYVIIYGASFSGGEASGFIPDEWGVPILMLVGLALGLWLYLLCGKLSNQRGMIAVGVVLGISLLCMTASSELILPELRQLLLNILLFFIAGSMIAYAVAKNSSALVNVCVAAIVIHVMTRYFDVFWDMLHGSVFFIVTGLVLFAVAGFMEWQRRRLLKRMRNQGEGGEA